MLWAVFLLTLGCHVSMSVGNAVPATSENIAYRSAAYYVSWASYKERNFLPNDLPVSDLTHVLYAFANVNNETGEVYLSDKWADIENPLSTEAVVEKGTNLRGCLQQLYILKKKNRHLKILLSIGGATYSSNFAEPASTEQGRSKFASSAVDLVKDLGLDGLDVDWEFPEDDSQASNMVLLLQGLRKALDAYGNSLKTPYHFQLSVASPAGPFYYEKMHLADMDKYVDFWNLMAWDYSVGSAIAAHQSNLFKSVSNPLSTPFDTSTAVKHYISKGIIPQKLILGIPLYGRSFNNTDGPGKSYSGVGNGTWEDGVYDFKDLPVAGSLEVYDPNIVAGWSYRLPKELVTYDSMIVASRKAEWVHEEKLGGIVWWESSADRCGAGSLIRNTVAAWLREGSSLDAVANHLNYPDSVYDNVRDDSSVTSIDTSISKSISSSPPSLSTSTSDQNCGKTPVTCTVENCLSKATPVVVSSSTEVNVITLTVSSASISSTLPSDLVDDTPEISTEYLTTTLPLLTTASSRITTITSILILTMSPEPVK